MNDHRLTREAIAGFERLVLDGGWGTEFEKRGGHPGECFDFWNLSEPERVKSVAQSYVDAGSDIILTNSFRSNRIALERYGSPDEAAAINRAAAGLSREAAGARVWVLGSMGPCGKLLSMGEIERSRVYDAFAEQALALVEGGADALVLETMVDLAEVEVALEALRKEVTVPYGVCMTFDSGPDRLHTMMGVAPLALLEAATGAGASFVGANCGLGIEGYMPVAKLLAESGQLPVWIKPNAGLPILEQGRVVYPVGPEQFASLAGPLFANGAKMVGGCCGTTPDFVRALKRSIKG